MFFAKDTHCIGLWLHLIESQQFLSHMNLINVCVAFGAVLQGSLFGLVGLLPQKYSAVFMSGQGLAGTFAALAMLFAIASESHKHNSKLMKLRLQYDTACWTLPSALCFNKCGMLIHVFCVTMSGETNEETAALGYFTTPCVGTLITLICYLLLPKLVRVFVFS